jgi:1-acylglycerone phosphate reductase
LSTTPEPVGGALSLCHVVVLTQSGYALPLLDSDLEVAKKMFNVNVFAVVEVTTAFAPLLIAAKGTIINIGSVTGKFPYAWQGYYNASKAAINLLTDQLRIELKPFGVNAINVVTGGVHTKLFDNQPPTKLPADSIYAPWRKEIEWAADGGVIKAEWIPVEKYAEQVVKNALRTKPNVYLWIGSSASIIWFFSTFMWHTIFVSVLILSISNADRD